MGVLWNWRFGDAVALVEVEEQLHLAGGQDLLVSGLRIQQRVCCVDQFMFSSFSDQVSLTPSQVSYRHLPIR